jgi:hypothetical protein
MAITQHKKGRAQKKQIGFHKGQKSSAAHFFSNRDGICRRHQRHPQGHPL